MITLLDNVSRSASLQSCLFQNMVLLEACIEANKERLICDPEITVFGKKCHQRRNVGFFCDDVRIEGYRYSGQIMKSQPLMSELCELLHIINEMFNASFNAILINCYKNGEDYIGRHSDDEAGLDPIQGVVSISYGASRIFRIRDKKGNKIMDHITIHGECLHMTGNFQEEYTHEIPIEKRVKNKRYSLTFRYHKV